MRRKPQLCQQTGYETLSRPPHGLNCDLVKVPGCGDGANRVGNEEARLAPPQREISGGLLVKGLMTSDAPMEASERMNRNISRAARGGGAVLSLVALVAGAAGASGVAAHGLSKAANTIPAGFQDWSEHNHHEYHTGVSGETILNAATKF